MLSELPLVSLITVSFNSEKTIKDTIESVLSQTYEKIEYIIIDGLSKDGTVSIAEAYTDRFLEKGYSFTIISEKDNGLYDAMNKGVLKAKGQIIGILNSDDFYVDQLVIEKVINKMVYENADCLYANLIYVDNIETDKIVRKWVSKRGDFRLGWNPPHPTTFITKTTYEKFGLYKAEYKISSDYDLLYKIIYKGKAKIAYLNEFIVKMRTGGESTRGLKSNILASVEIYKTLKENNHKLKLILIFLRLIVKVKQFL